MNVQVDGIWHHLPAHGEIDLKPGETITLPSNLSHIINVLPGGCDVIMLETSTANNDSSDNIFPFMTPTSKTVHEDVKARYQLLDEHQRAVLGHLHVALGLRVADDLGLDRG